MFSEACNKAKKIIKIEISDKEINGALIRGDGKILCEKKSALCGIGETLIKETVGLINSLIHCIGWIKSDIRCVLIRCLGQIEEERGVVNCAQLGFDYYPVAKSVSEKTGLRVRIYG
ncbi:MAG: hypothetical protein K2L42_04955 [Clostridia bacterium]|nr:hypothetical protein [Clostridia bacterium]